MPYTVSTPRRFDFETRLFGLTLKQWGYLSIGIAVAGLIGLGVLIPGLPLGVRIALGLVVMAPPAAVAYLKYRGLPLDRALLAWVRYRRDPRHRVWRKGFFEYLIEEELVEPEASAIAVDREAVLATVMVLLNLMVIAILLSATWYMLNGGFKDLVHWLSRA
jgi:hypothetical protein